MDFLCFFIIDFFDIDFFDILPDDIFEDDILSFDIEPASDGSGAVGGAGAAASCALAMLVISGSEATDIAPIIAATVNFFSIKSVSS